MSHVDLAFLLGELQSKSPAKANALSLHGRKINYGLLSVGLKIHCLRDTGGFSPLFNELGGKEKLLETNKYRGKSDAFCWPLPAVGSARYAIMLLECITDYTGVAIFNNPDIQIQVCSPGRLGSRRAGLLTIGAYLGSDILGSYSLDQLTTTFSFAKELKNDYLQRFARGRRLTIYDAGVLNKDFEWWGQPTSIRWKWGSWLWKQGVIKNNLPLTGRTDVMLRTSKIDIRIVNLIATLLMHKSYDGYWTTQGALFEEEMIQILTNHGLLGHLNVPWIHDGEGTPEEDARYIDALREIMAYAVAEAVRIKQGGKQGGILHEIYILLSRLRTEIENESRHVIDGSQT